MMDIAVLHAQVIRGSTKVPWGLQFQGGNGQPLLVAQISAGGPAAKIGIRPGDRVTQIQGKNVTKMASPDVITLMNQQGCTLLLTVERPVPNGSQLDQNQPQAPKTIANSNNHHHQSPPSQPSSSSTSVFRPRPPLWYTPPTKVPPRDAVSSLGDNDSHRNDRPSDDTCHLLPVEQRQDLVSEIPSFSNNLEDHSQFEYQTVHAQPFSRCGRLTPRQRQNTADSRSSSEAEQAPSASSPHSFTSPCYSPSPNYYTLSSDVTGPQQLHSDVSGEPYDDKLTQSRTFRILQSLMFNEAPPSGDLALPPPRSASLEQRREEELQRRAAATTTNSSSSSSSSSGRPQRIRVFMPQQYNSPLSMYSAPNIINTFQDQAEKYFESLERKNRQEQPNVYVEDRGFYEY